MRTHNLAFPAALATALSVTPVFAEPKVATDIGPVHSLVARVMAGVGKPDVVIPPGASPHNHAMRPSEAAALQQADVVFWIGEALTPQFARALNNLAGDAVTVSLMEVPGTTLRPFREGATFEAHSHGEHEHGHDDHGHADHASADAHDDHGHDHDDHGHADHASADAHDDHGHDHDDHGHAEHASADAHDDHGHDDHAHDDHGHADDHHGHSHSADATDPHIWLDPGNAIVWVGAIAQTLSQVDPDNAAVYAQNAEAAEGELEALIAEIEGTLASLDGRRFVVFHDAYQYFEERFGVEASGAISVGDASSPGPRRVAEIQDTISDLGVTCVFSEPQYPAQIVDTVIEGTDTRTGVLDPIGVELSQGPDLYPTLLRNLATNLVACLVDAS